MNKNKGSVLLVSEYFLPHWTGISQAFFYLTKNLQDQGFTTTVLTTQFDTKLPLKEEIRGVDIIRSPFQFQISRTHYSWRILIDFIRLLPRYDWVVINSPNSNILFYSLLTKIYRKRLAIYHEGDLILPKQTGNIVLHKLIEFIFDILTISSMALADFTSSFTLDYAQNSRVLKYFLGKFRAYIPKIDVVTDKPDKLFAHKLNSYKKNHTLVGLAGRFVEEKGFDIVLKAIPEVIKVCPNVLFVFAGKEILAYEPFFEKYKNEIQQQKKYLQFLGLLSKENLACFYASLDVFVIASRSECFGLTQIEAMQQHIPIVVTDTPGARMLVTSSGFGIIVKKEDPISLSNGIIEVIRNTSKIVKHYQKATHFLKKHEKFKLD